MTKNCLEYDRKIMTLTNLTIEYDQKFENYKPY